MIMKKLRNCLLNGLLVCAVLFVFSQQGHRFTGDRQRTYEIGYLKGYEEGRKIMCDEFEQRMATIKNARKMQKAGYELDN